MNILFYSSQATCLQTENVPPIAEVPLSTDAASRTTRQVPSLSDSSYLPAVMQAIAYYVELIQYEPLYTTTIEPPYTLPGTGGTAPTTTRPPWPTQSTTRWTSTTSRPSTTTTKWPVTTTTTRRPWSTYFESTTQHHSPGQFAPSSPPKRPLYDEVITSPLQNNHLSGRPTTTRKPFVAQVGPLPILSISNNQYFDWYTQNKGKHIQKDSGKFTIKR